MKKRLMIALFAASASAAVVAAYVVSGSASPPRITGGTAEARQLLADRLPSLPQADIDTVLIGSPSPADVFSGIPDRGDNWLWITARANNKADAVASAWEASLLASAFADDATARGVRDITGLTVRILDSNGDLLEENAWTIPPASQAPLPALYPDLQSAQREVSMRLEAGVNTLGGHLNQTVFRAIPRLAVDATITVPNPAAFVRKAPELLSRVIWQDQNYDARLIRVVDRSGNPVLVSALNFRTRAGEVWVDPKLIDRYPSRLYVEP